MPRIPNLPKWPEITWISSSPDLLASQGSPAPNILGINPWAYDFAAYNLWSRPLGLISALEAFRACGCNVALLDCLDRTWWDVDWPEPDSFGCGRYPRTVLPKPADLDHVPRRFCRYGLPLNAVSGALARMDPVPDLVLITANMTYWYPGAITAAVLAKRFFPRTPVALGGVYATLCNEHARKSVPVDLVLQGPVEEEQNWSRIWSLMDSTSPEPPRPDAGRLLPSLYPGAEYSVLLGSRGCPFTCPYCSSRLLYPGFSQFHWKSLWTQVQEERAKGVRDFAFYDDALLVQPHVWLEPFLQTLIEKRADIRLHVPNGLHAAYLEPHVCRLLFRAGLTTVRLGLESANFRNRPDKKLTRQEWDYGVGNLFRAGFKPEDTGAYILFGLPGQSEEEVMEAISFAKSFGIRPHLAYYSPIPGTAMFERAERYSPYPLRDEPLCQNRAIWPCYPAGFSWAERNRWLSQLRAC